MITVTFDPQGGTLEDSEKTVTKRYGAVIGDDLPTPKRDDMKFAGWFTTKQAGLRTLLSRTFKLLGNPSSGEEITESSTMPANNTTYYAHYDEYIYEIVGTGQKFIKLQEAIDAAPEGDSVIQSLKEHAETTNATVPAGKNITLKTEPIAYAFVSLTFRAA